MSFLPIVDRELRLAARRKGTYRVRWWTALVAMLGGFVGLLFTLVAGGPGRLANGWLFTLLTGYAFLLCLLTGVLLTADCLSQEKREGTLGLLFLTDLKGYDVVLGKFIATSLNAFYGLLALLPIMALPMLLGGVTGGDFWRTSLALVNTLFFSLVAGLCVSAFSRVGERALRNALALVLLVSVGLPMLTTWLPRLGVARIWPSVAWLSPVSAFALARQGFSGVGSATFWKALFVSHALGWGLLALASYALPLLWQERAPGFWRWSVRRQTDPQQASARRARARARLLPLHPVLWLLGDEPALRWMIWAVVAGWGVTVLVMSPSSSGDPRSLFVACKICGFLLKLLVTFQACRFFVEARRSGALELLLCTPLRSHDILRGQWLALKRLVFWPILVAVLFGFVPFGLQVAADLATHQRGMVAMAFLRFLGCVLAVGWCTIGLVADIITVTWVGMWLALSSRKPGSAALQTIFVVLVLPSVAVCGLDLLVDLLLVAWSATRLQQDYRWVLARP
jgi:hypothetical protein